MSDDFYKARYQVQHRDERTGWTIQMHELDVVIHMTTRVVTGPDFTMDTAFLCEAEIVIGKGLDRIVRRWNHQSNLSVMQMYMCHGSDDVERELSREIHKIKRQSIMELMCSIESEYADDIKAARNRKRLAEEAWLSRPPVEYDFKPEPERRKM